MYAVDVNERALELTRANAAAAGLGNVRACLPGRGAGRREVRPHLVEPADPGGQGGAPRPARHLAAAADRRRARRYLVVQKNLGADSLQRWLRESLELPCDRFAVAKGFRVLRVSRRG